MHVGLTKSDGSQIGAAMLPVVSVVMPCLNEELTVGRCVEQAVAALAALGLLGEVVVCDNGSTDNSQRIASQAGARVVSCSERGYGNSVRTAILTSLGEFIVVADTDGSHDLSSLGAFVRPLQQGADLVIGNRFRGGIAAGAMPRLNRYFGNPGLTWLINRLCHAGVGDTQCGMRGMTRAASERMALECEGMELASEMLVKAARSGLRIVEVPTRMFRDGRDRGPHLLPGSDGWRHLKFLLMFSPLHLFLIPGAVATVLGLLLTLLPLRGVFRGGRYYLDIHWMVLGVLLLLMGIQIMQFGVIARLYTVVHCFPESDKTLDWLRRHLRLERGLIAGILLFGIGLAVDLWIAVEWIRPGPALMQVRPALLATALMAIGTQTFFFSFLFAIMQRRPAKTQDRQ